MASTITSASNPNAPLASTATQFYETNKQSLATIARVQEYRLRLLDTMNRLKLALNQTQAQLTERPIVQLPPQSPIPQPQMAYTVNSLALQLAR